jgi:hypothetical protein
VNVLAVVPAQLLLLLHGPRSHWLLDITPSVLAADHETDLPGWVGGDGGVCVFRNGEDLLAVFLELGDEFEV